MVVCSYLYSGDVLAISHCLAKKHGNELIDSSTFNHLR